MHVLSRKFWSGSHAYFAVQFIQFHVEVWGEYEKTRKTMPEGKKKAEIIPFPGLIALTLTL